MESTPNRIPSLDGLRTVSIALVVLGHFFHVIGLGQSGNLGNLGVRVFFVISGFLITGLLVKEMDKTSTIGLLKFYFRRTLRIFPPYYFFLLIILIASLDQDIFVRLRSLFFAAAYATDYINPANWYLGHTWSLAVEEQFYLILPGVLLLLGIRRSKIFLLFIVACLPVIRVMDFHLSGPDQMWVLKGFHANMDALAIGCLLTLFRTTLQNNSVYKRFLASPVVALLPVVIMIFNVQYEHPNLFYGVSISVMNISIALCIDWTVTNYTSVAGRVLNSSPFVTLGGMSYSIYLWQQPFFNPENTAAWARFPLNLVGLTVMTLISYFVVERYSLKLRHKWETRFFGAKKPVAADQLGFAG